MSKLRAKLRHSQLFELLRQKTMADRVSVRLRVSNRSDGEGPETLMFREMASRSLRPAQGRSL